MRQFRDFVVIDWSGQAVARPRGLAVAHAREGTAAPALLSPRDGWSRDDILGWMMQHAEAGTDMLVGLDLSPAFPFVDAGAYFPGWAQSPPDARKLWALVEDIARDDPHLAATSFVTHAEAGRHFRRQGDCGDLFPPGAGRFRICEHRQRGAGVNPYSCFNLVGTAQVGKSSLTGMRVLHALSGKIPVWPFDPVPQRGPLIVEIYTAIAARAAQLRKGTSKILDPVVLDSALAILGSSAHAPLARYTDHATDAILTAAWLRASAHRAELWSPLALTPAIARTEGWTFGVT